jgi:small subunit ribosomal protein S9
LIPGGNGTIVINDRAFEDYFPQGTLQYIVKQPIALLEVESKYDIIVNVIGGGYTGQAGAIRLGVARALLEAEENSRPALKAAGFLTRDPRAKERKKYGLKKARRAPQFSKRLRLGCPNQMHTNLSICLERFFASLFWQITLKTLKFFPVYSILYLQ